MIYFRPFILISFLLIVFQASAQNAYVDWGTNAKANKASGELQSLGWHKGFLYNLEQEAPGTMKMGGKYRLEKISNNMHLIFSKELDANTNYFSSSVCFIKDERINIFSVDYSLSPRRMTIVRHVFDLNGNKINTHELAEISLKKVNLSNYSYNSLFALSDDKSKVAFASSSTKAKDGNTNINLLVFNSGEVKNISGQIVEKSITHEAPIESYNYQELGVLNDGTIIIKAVKKIEDQAIKLNSINIFSPSGEVLKEMDLNLGNGIYASQVKTYFKDNKVSFTGMLESLNEKNNPMIGGFFLANLDVTDFSITNISPIEYTREFFESLGYKVKKDGTVEFYGRYLIDLELKSNGGGFLIASKRYETSTSLTSEREIVIYPFNENYELNAPLIVPRGMSTYHPLLNGLGYFAFVEKENLYLVYTDHEDNINNKDIEDLEYADNPKDKKAVITIAEIKNDGKVTRKILSEENEIKGYLMPDKCQSDESLHVINVGNKKKVLYGQLKFR